MWIQGIGNEFAHSLATSNIEVIPCHLQPFLCASPELGSHPYANLLPSSHFEMARLQCFLKYIDRERLNDVTPPRIFENLALSRSHEIFINKVLANAATTPPIIHKRLDTSIPCICTFCHSSCLANIEHLILHCPALHHYHKNNKILLHSNLEAVQRDILKNPHQLVTLAYFVISSGLVRVISCVPITPPPPPPLSLQWP